MTRFRDRRSVQLLIFATALPFGLLVAGAAPTYAAVVIVTGTNGACCLYEQPGGAGQPANADAGHLIPNSDSLNTAKAAGGNGGAGWIGPLATGGKGGDATSTATTDRTTGLASAFATATGGAGGKGGVNNIIFGPAPSGGNGGQATATSSAVDTGSSAVTSSATANGGPGGAGGTKWTQYIRATGLPGSGGAATATATGQSTDGGAVTATASATGGNVAAGGMATATATGQSTASGAVNVKSLATGGAGGASGAAKAYATGVAVNGNVQSNASANGGAGVIPGTAFAQSEAKNASGEALTTASAPGAGTGTSPSAVTAAGVGSVSLAPANMTPGGAVSTAIGPAGLNFGEGAMSAAYSGEPLKYEATAVFDFSTTKSEGLYLDLISDDLALVGIGFDSLELTVTVDGSSIRYQNTFSPSSAESFFAAGKSYPLGTIAAGNNQSIELDFLLSYNTGTKALVGDGFGFAYKFVDPPASGVPEPTTWAMMLIGFAGLGFAGFRAARLA
jgi:hypothetical protein